jgi:protein phosphatase
MVCLRLPSDAPIRVIPDVHGERAALERLVREARAEGRFIIQLGDVVDRGPDSAGALELMLDLIDAGDAIMLMGNHELKIIRALTGHAVRLGEDGERTLREINAVPGLAARFLAASDRMPFSVRHGMRLFVHGAWDPAMTSDEPMTPETYRRAHVRALFGQTTGRRDPKGRPERIWDWVDELPAGLEVIVGHDWRAPCVVLERLGRGGGRVRLLDLGAGKGGALAHMDIEADGSAHFSHPLARWEGAVYDLAEAS